MPVKPQTALTRSRVISCVLVNQLATPGLGSVLCRKYFSGLCQLLLATAGFTLLLGWMCQFFYRMTMDRMGEPVPPGSYGWMARWGLICFGIAWFWSLGTSLILLWQVKGQDEPTSLPPPRVSGRPPTLPGDRA
jgi:hypothetical protein